MHVSDILKSKGGEVVSVDPGKSLGAVARMLAGHRIGAVVVLDDKGQMVGIVSERDIVTRIAADGARALETAVSDTMSREVVTCAASDTIAEVMGVMTHRRIRHLPVVAGGGVTGIISIGDVVKHRIEETEMEARVLRDYVRAGH